MTERAAVAGSNPVAHPQLTTIDGLVLTRFLGEARSAPGNRHSRRPRSRPQPTIPEGENRVAAGVLGYGSRSSAAVAASASRVGAASGWRPPGGSRA